MTRMALLCLVVVAVVVSRAWTQPLPDIPGDFRVSEELTTNGVTSYMKDVVYTDTHQAIRYERRASKLDAASFYSLDPLVSVHDYNIGVSFTMNKVRRNCTMSPISILTFDTQWNFSNSLMNVEEAYVIRLKSPKAFFQLDTDYKYSGEDSVSGVPATVFTSEFDKNTSHGFVKINNAFAFSAESIVFQQTGMKAKQIPMRLKTMEENKPEASSHFYDFDQIDDMRWFDVSECFNDVDSSGTIDFIVKFKSLDGGGILLPEEKTLVNQAIQSLIKYTNESFTRFTRPRLSLSEDGILYMRSTILPPPPPLSYFTGLDGLWLYVPSVATTREANNTAECAARCVAIVNCLSFDYSFNSNNCYLNSKHILDASTGSISGVQHFSRNTLNGFYSRPVYEIMNLFEVGVDNKNFTITIGGKVLQAIAVDEIEVNENGRYGATQLLSRYDLRYANKKFAASKDRSYANTNVDECARACNNEAAFECRSFDFCYTSGDCRLSKEIVSDDQAQFLTSIECDVYEKNALFHYTEYPSKSFTNENDLKYVPVQSPSECAIKCDNELDLHCRSFNYCPDQKICYLSDKHAIDSAEIDNRNPNLTCTHYSRDFTADFTYTSSATIPLEAEIVYGDMTLDMCALMCVAADGFSCKTIDFCPESKKCLLHSSNAKAALAVV